MLLSLIQNPKGFTIDLLEFLGSQAQYLHSLMALTASNNLDASKSSDRLGAVEQALEALRNVIKSNPGMHVVDVLCVLFVCWIGLKITLHDVFMLDFCSQSLFEIIGNKSTIANPHS